jgi:hypothetical protein
MWTHGHGERRLSGDWPLPPRDDRGAPARPRFDLRMMALEPVAFALSTQVDRTSGSPDAEATGEARTSP